MSDAKQTLHIRIKGDGPPRNWTITNADTGDRIPVSDLRIHATPEKCEVVITVLVTGGIDLTTEAEVIEKKRARE